MNNSQNNDPIKRIIHIKRGQLKVQEMAFVLVALIVFFALVALLYLSIRSSLLEQSARDSSDERASEAVRQLASTPELTWSECHGCIDLDKTFILKERIVANASLKALWNYDYLVLESIYPAQQGGECTPATYPSCNRTTIITTDNYGIAKSAFVTLCRWNAEEQNICTLGRIYLSDRGGKDA